MVIKAWHMWLCVNLQCYYMPPLAEKRNTPNSYFGLVWLWFWLLCLPYAIVTWIIKNVALSYIEEGSTPTIIWNSGTLLTNIHGISVCPIPKLPKFVMCLYVYDLNRVMRWERENQVRGVINCESEKSKTWPLDLIWWSKLKLKVMWHF